MPDDDNGTTLPLPRRVTLEEYADMMSRVSHRKAVARHRDTISPQKLREIRLRDAEKKRRQRAAATEEEREAARLKRMTAAHERRASESDEQREKRKAAQRARTAASRARARYAEELDTYLEAPLVEGETLSSEPAPDVPRSLFPTSAGASPSGEYGPDDVSEYAGPEDDPNYHE
jgi:hypothetical protein